MNKTIEEGFVNRFVVRSKRERVLYELNSDKKRGHAIQQLTRFLDDRYLVFCKQKVTDGEFFGVIEKYIDTNSSCYVIGDCADDGKSLSFTDAFDRMMNGGGEYIIIGKDGNTVVIKTEDPIAFLPDKMIYHR